MDRRGSRWFARMALACAVACAAGCGHSEDEWQAKLRENDDLQTKLNAEQAQAKKSRAELDESTTTIEQLKQQLKTAGVDLSNLNANLETQARAIEEYRRHSEQIEGFKRRFELLRTRLGPFSKQGVAVTVRDNRLVISLDGDAIFDAGKETLKKEGHDLLLKVAEVIRSDPGLTARSFQVADHVETTPAGGRFKDAVGLSAMRAREVVALLVQPSDKGGGGLDPNRWSAAGYGDRDTLRSNDTQNGKQQARRCELIVQPNVEELLDLRGLLR